MPIHIIEQWQCIDGFNLIEKYVHVDAVLIGRVRCRQISEPSGVTREQFTAERWKGDSFISVEEPGAEFEEALQRLVFYEGR